MDPNKEYNINQNYRDMNPYQDPNEDFNQIPYGNKPKIPMSYYFPEGGQQMNNKNQFFSDRGFEGQNQQYNNNKFKGNNNNYGFNNQNKFQDKREVKNINHYENNQHIQGGNENNEYTNMYNVISII